MLYIVQTTYWTFVSEVEFLIKPLLQRVTPNINMH
jgi:hypothetical protein